MHRNALIKELMQYRDNWPEERGETDRFLDFVTDQPDCFRRQLVGGHVTAAGWIESADGTQVLLLHHRKLDRWLQPGGHADGDSDVLRVARREVFEETGLEGLASDAVIFDLDIHPIPAQKTEPRHLHYDVRYRLTAPADAVPVANHESHELRWFDVQEVAGWDEVPSLSRMAIKSLQLWGS